MNTIRQHLGWKLFISYVIVIAVGVVSLAVTAETKSTPPRPLIAT